ncbi:hypothetical protein GCM10012288_21690 [Malaciobacter pacificus]|nr:hypothetical protein GCM10012288_21690 [Malaciobacter pacificus]
MISEKKRLPSVAILDTRKDKKTKTEPKTTSINLFLRWGTHLKLCPTTNR